MATERIYGIVTNVIKHSDRQDIVTLFCREQGRVALLSATGAGKSARLRRAALLPLSVISADVSFHGNRELQFLGRFNRETLWKNLYFDPVKSAVSIFLAEFLNAFLRHTPADTSMWDYIVRSVAALDAHKGVPANFHLAFLIEFLSFAGIRPDLTDKGPGDSWFDMEGGTLSELPPLHRNSIEPECARLLPLLQRMNLRTQRVFRFSGLQRRELLRGLLRYYGTHFPGLDSLKSPAVLEELFS